MDALYEKASEFLELLKEEENREYVSKYFNKHSLRLRKDCVKLVNFTNNEIIIGDSYKSYIRIILIEGEVTVVSSSYMHFYGEYLEDMFVNEKQKFEGYLEQNKPKTPPHYIYIIKNKSNGMCYVGKTMCNPWYRWKTHATCGDSKISQVIDSDGIENFSFDVLEKVDLKGISAKDIDKHVAGRERFYIDKYDSLKNGYNRNLPKSNES